MKEFVVNEYITLKLENGKTNIYVNGQRFRKCTYLLINIPIEEVSSLDDIESIDEAIERLDKKLERQEITIPPETEFWGHCSNLQVWAENSYNTKLLTQDLAFPLLKKLSSLDPTASRIFKEEIAKRFSSGNKTVIYFLTKEKYIDFLDMPEEREILFYDNNEEIRALADDILVRIGYLRPYEQRILRILINLGDPTLKEKLLALLDEILTPSNLETFNPEILRIYFKYFLGSSENKALLYYKNNQKIRELLNKTLKDERYMFKIAIPILLKLSLYGDPRAIQLYKETILELFFEGDPASIEKIIRTYLFRSIRTKRHEYKDTELVQRIHFFNYDELEALAKDPQCPEQYLPHWNRYKEKMNTIISFTKVSFILKEELLKGTDFMSKLKIPNSDYFLMIEDERDKRKKIHPIPIYDKQVRKITINSTESPIEPIIETIESLRAKLKFIYEAYSCTTTLLIGTKNTYELYFLDDHILPAERIKDLFTLISKDIKIKIKNHHK